MLCDGGEPNRSFLKLLLPYGSHPADHPFIADNLHTGGKIVTMADSKVRIIKTLRCLIDRWLELILCSGSISYLKNKP